MFHKNLIFEIGRILNFGIKTSAHVSANTLNGIFTKSRLDSESLSDLWLKILREELVEGFDELGPFYTKAIQILLSQDDSSWLRKNFDLNIFLKDLPTLDFAVVEMILDQEIPAWRLALKVDANPIGSASIGQVHKATDLAGKEWAIKVLKPNGAKRLRETYDAFQEILTDLKSLAFTFTQKKILADFEMFLRQLRKECSFSHEKLNIEKAQLVIAGQRSDLIAVPKLLEKFCTDRVLVMEYFEGFSLVDVLTHKVLLREKNRKELAHDLLSEILVQVFELGFFHADPHAGNIMVLKRGGLGLFDWGLVGQFEEADRIFIATVLKSLLTMDKERLVDALHDLVKHQGQTKLNREKITREVERVIAGTQKKSLKNNSKPIRSIAASIEVCMLAAEKLKIQLPEGLILMIKTLITVEGLAKNIDADISMLHAAIPVLLRTAKPSGTDLLKLLWKSPHLIKKML